MPPAAELPERIDAVLAVVHLLFTTGHTAPAGDDWCGATWSSGRSSWPGCCAGCCPTTRRWPGCSRCCCSPTPAARPGPAPTAGCCCSRSRTASRWDRGAIAEGAALVREALRGRPPGRFALQAAIAAVHAEAPSWDDTDWREIVALYDVLVQLWPSPVVALNRAVAVGFAGGADAGLAALDALAGEPQLAGYGYLPAARADFLRRLGRVDEARDGLRRGAGAHRATRSSGTSSPRGCGSSVRRERRVLRHPAVGEREVVLPGLAVARELAVAGDRVAVRRRTCR